MCLCVLEDSGNFHERHGKADFYVTIDSHVAGPCQIFGDFYSLAPPSMSQLKISRYLFVN